MRLPVLVVWGESDRVADPEYGRAFAAAIPGARFQLLSGTGHMPMLETPDLDDSVHHPIFSTGTC